MLDWLTGGFTGGAITAVCFVLAVLFLKYWRVTRDFLFLAFSAAFALMGVSHMLRSLASGDAEDPWNYVLRFIAFLFISIAIARKNFQRKTD